MNKTMLINEKVFIISALVKRGPFHATKVNINIIMCKTLTGKSGFFAVTGVTAWVDGSHVLGESRLGSNGGSHLVEVEALLSPDGLPSVVVLPWSEYQQVSLGTGVEVAPAWLGPLRESVLLQDDGG